MNLASFPSTEASMTMSSSIANSSVWCEAPVVESGSAHASLRA
jgi:hypothetical protein